MRSPERIDSVLAEIGRIWKEVPDWRFMQLICNFQRYIGSDGFYLEEDRLVHRLGEMRKEMFGKQ